MLPSGSNLAAMQRSFGVPFCFGWPVTLALLGCATTSVPDAATPLGNTSAAVSAPVPERTCALQPRPDPLVTEWPASEKAHLQSIFARQPVAVHYDGCELQIIDECKLAGNYTWTAEPVASTTLRIESKAELESKLPIGGFRLESELQRSGSLELETTPAGRFALSDTAIEAPDLGPCTQATHLVTAITVGSFRLLGAGRQRSATELDVGAQVGTNSTRDEDLLRQAGLAETCTGGSLEGPAIQCASPLRLNLSPLRISQPKDALERARKAGEVMVQIAVLEPGGGSWTLHDRTGTALCAIPCARWMRPSGGYTLRHSDAFGIPRESIAVDGGFPVAPGGQALGIVHPEQGAPSTARIVFWSVGAPSLVIGAMLSLSGALSWLNSGGDSGPGMLGVGLGMSAAGGGLYLWHHYSHEGYFEVRRGAASSKQSAAALNVNIGPMYLRGTF